MAPALGTYAQEIKATKITRETVGVINPVLIEKREKSGDVEFLESNRKIKKVENEHSFDTSHNLPVPRTATGETFRVVERPNSRPSSQGSHSVQPLSNPDYLMNSGVSFPAIIDNQKSIPPDCAGAVGPDHLMTALNTEIKIQNKNGDSLSQVSLDGFFSPITGANEVFDPKLLYDKIAGRWIITAVAHSNSPSCLLLIAISEGNNPLGAWKGFSYKVDSTSKMWFDYPSLGMNMDWIVVSGNMYNVELDGSAAALKKQTIRPHSKIYVFDRKLLYAGESDVSVFDLPSDAGFTITPSVSFSDTTSILYLISMLNSNYQGKAYLQLYTISRSADGPHFFRSKFTPNVNITWSDISKNSQDDFGPQKSVAELVNNGDSRIQNAVFRDGSLWCTHTVFLPTNRPTHSAVAWWQINPLNGRVSQFGKIEDRTARFFYAFPSIAINKDTDVVIGYASFSNSQFVSSNFSFRSKRDPANTMNASLTFKKGVSKYFKKFGGAKNRWGDYTTTCVDTDDTTFWTLQEYAESKGEDWDRWGTQWKQIKKWK
jgi:hypothetical protein